MAYFISIFGFLLSLAGGSAIFFGYAIVDIERGWTAVISGSVLLSGGMIMMSLAAVAGGLNRLSRNLENETQPGIGPQRTTPASLSGIAASSEPAFRAARSFSEPRRNAAVEQGSEDRGPDLRAGSAHADEAAKPESILPEAQLAEHALAEEKSAEAPVLRETKFLPPRWGAARPHALSSERSDSSQKEEQQEPLSLRHSWEAPLQAIVSQRDELVPPAAGKELPQATEPAQSHLQPPGDSQGLALAEKKVTGRYEADGIVYTMFEDGSIEAKSETELVHYASMEALKASFARELEG